MISRAFRPSFLPSSSPPFDATESALIDGQLIASDTVPSTIYLVIDTGTVSVEARNEICIGLPDSQMLCVTVLVCTNVYSVGHDVSVQTEACGYVAACVPNSW
jgi:hypothetical protein